MKRRPHRDRQIPVMMVKIEAAVVQRIRRAIVQAKLGIGQTVDEVFDEIGADAASSDA